MQGLSSDEKRNQRMCDSQTWTWRTWVFIVIELVLLWIMLVGCSVLPTGPSPPSDPLSASQSIIYSTIRSTDWLMSVLLMGCVLGLFAGFNGLKVGWAGLAACVGGMVLKADMSSTYVYWACGLMVLGTVLAAIASVLLKNRAVRELIVGVQKVKQDPSNGVSGTMRNEQTRPTVDLVNSVKAKLKTKGVI